MSMALPEVSRRSFLMGLGKAALGGAGALIVTSREVKAHGTAWWETLSQAQRNQYIVSRAREQVGQYFGDPNGQCKVWVQNLVRYVSVTHVQLPLNNPSPNDWYWQDDPYGHAIGQCMFISSAVSGQIVQMKYKSSGIPHTAIVVVNDGSGIKFIASNDPMGSYTVRERYWKFADFHAAMSAFAVYTIR